MGGKRNITHGINRTSMMIFLRFRLHVFIYRAMADNVFNKSAIFYALLQSPDDVSGTETWLQGNLA